jgi:hypothetical protein
LTGPERLALNQGRGVGLGHHVCHIPRKKTGVDGNQDGADFCHSEQDEQVLGALDQPQAHVVTRVHSDGDQRPGGAIGLVTELSTVVVLFDGRVT